VENFYVSAETQNLMLSVAICTRMYMRTKNVGEHFSGGKYDKVVRSRLQQCVWMSVCISTVTHPKIGCGCCASAAVCIQKSYVEKFWKNLEKFMWQACFCGWNVCVHVFM